MSWIKRNLIFVIGASVALLLMVGAGFYTWTRLSHHAAAREELDTKYAELKRLTELKIGPGSGKVDNIKTAREQQVELRHVLAEATKQYNPIPAIPEGDEVTAETFARGLSRTVADLQRDATNAGVVLPPKFTFSFQQQSSLMKFAPGSLGPLAVQLGEVKALSEVLIAAKVNSVDGIQRERVSTDDQQGAQTDYLDRKSETNELAVLTPYQITFRSFTPELAQVLCGFASSPHGMIVKSFSVEPAPTATFEATIAPVMPYYAPAPVYRSPQFDADASRGAAFQRRYGGGGKDGIGLQPPPAYAQPQYAAPVPVAVSTAPRAVVDEKQLKVTMLVEVVKLQPKK